MQSKGGGPHVRMLRKMQRSRLAAVTTASSPVVCGSCCTLVLLVWTQESNYRLWHVLCCNYAYNNE